MNGHMALRCTYRVCCLLLLVSIGLGLSGCVARSAYVDELAQQQTKTAETLANLAKSYENLTNEIGSAQAPVAGKIAYKAEEGAADSLDLSDQSSGISVDAGAIANKALTGDWVGLAGIAISTLLGAGGVNYIKNKQLKKVNQLAEEVAELEPTDARKVLKARKPS